MQPLPDSFLLPLAGYWFPRVWTAIPSRLTSFTDAPQSQPVAIASKTKTVYIRQQFYIRASLDSRKYFWMFLKFLEEGIWLSREVRASFFPGNIFTGDIFYCTVMNTEQGSETGGSGTSEASIYLLPTSEDPKGGKLGPDSETKGTKLICWATYFIIFNYYFLNWLAFQKQNLSNWLVILEILPYDTVAASREKESFFYIVIVPMLTEEKHFLNVFRVSVPDTPPGQCVCVCKGKACTRAFMVSL